MEARTRGYGVTVLPHDHDWTVTDLDLLPDDGLRYELVDGVLLVSPAPSMAHQRCQRDLGLLLHPLLQADQELFFAPLDFQPTDRRSLQPDVLIMSREDKGDKAATLPLVLAVEVLSPSSRSIDMVLKRELYEQSGVLHYWVADPARRTVTIWDLADGRYAEAQVVSDAEPVTIVAPVSVTLTTEAVFGPA